jgi:hypothetical protein
MRVRALTGLVAGGVYAGLAALLAAAAAFENDPVAFAPVVLLAQPVASATADALGPILAITLGAAVNAVVFGLCVWGAVRSVAALRRAVRGS